MSGVRDEQRRTPPRNGPRCGATGEAACAGSHVCGLASPLVPRLQKRRTVNRTSNVNRQKTEPVLVRFRYAAYARTQAQACCVDPAAQQPTRPEPREPREPRGADDENRSGRLRPVTETPAPPPPTATCHFALVMSGSDLRRSVSENRVRRTDELGRSGPRV